MAKLEEKLDAQLIQRNRTGTIKLTPSGEYWFKSSGDLLGRLDTMLDEHRQRFLQNTVTWQMGVTPTLRGRFVAAAARIASRQPGFVKFEIKYAVTSNELVQQLRLHQLNCAIVSEDAIDDDRNSFAIAKLFDDQVAWLVPASVPLVDIKHALSQGAAADAEPARLSYFVDIDGNVSLRTSSSDWFRHNLPGCHRDLFGHDLYGGGRYRRRRAWRRPIARCRCCPTCRPKSAKRCRSSRSRISAVHRAGHAQASDDPARLCGDFPGHRGVLQDRISEGNDPAGSPGLPKAG